MSEDSRLEVETPPPAASQNASGLLDLLAQNAMDQDYTETALRRAAAAQSSGVDPSGVDPRRPKVSWTAALAFFCFALLVSTASMQRLRHADEVSRSRADLVSQVKVAKSRLNSDLRRAEQLTVEINSLQESRLSKDKDAQKLLSQTATLKASAGYGEMSGPGLRVTIDDAPHATEDAQMVLDRDLQRTANGLFEAGAEAISINGQRLGALTSIRTAGHSIGVNYRAIERPYVFLALGDPKTLPARFAQTEGGLYMQVLKKRYGLRFDIESARAMTVPAAPVPKLLFAIPSGSRQTAGGGQ